MSDPEQIRLNQLARQIVADNIGLPSVEIGRMLVEAGITRSNHMGPSLAIAAYQRQQIEQR